VAERDLGANRRQVVELHYRILGKARGQAIRKRLGPGSIPCQDERQSCFVLHVRPFESLSAAAARCELRLRFVKGFPQSRFGFVACRSFLLSCTLG